MDSSAQNFVTVNEILADVLKLVDDERYELASKGHYTSQIQQALEGLAFDTFFQKIRKSFDFPVETLGLPMPIGAFNIKEAYLFHGTECDISNSQKVWHKANYFTRGNGFFAKNKGHNHDPFIESSGYGGSDRQGYAKSVHSHGAAENAFYYNVVDGIVMFSSACRAYPKVHLVYNGTGCEIGDIPVIPIFLREAVKDYTTEVTLRIKMAKEPKTWTTLWQIYEKRLNRDEEYGMGQGSWFRAAQRIRNMSKGERDDLFEYLGSSSWSKGF